VGRNRRRRGQDLETVIARAVHAGYEEGMGRALVAAIEARAQSLLEEDYGEAAALLRGGQGSGRALSALDGVLAELVQGWAQKWEREMRTLLARVFEEVTRPAGDVLGVRFDPSGANGEMAAYFDSHIRDTAASIANTTRADVARAVARAVQRQGGGDEGATQESRADVAPFLEKKARARSASRAQRIARTELATAKNGGALLQAQASGAVVTKTWNSKRDAHSRDEHRQMHGTTVGINDPFPNGAQFPGEPECRCWLTFGIDRNALRGRTA
jgi:SPP1 gp7 family putative phage head morphogenesis protein